MRDFFKRFTGHFLPGEHNAYRPYLLRKPWLLFFLSVILTAEGIYAASFLAGQSAKQLLSAVVPGEVIALTNVERGRVGDGSLAENNLLDAAAQAKADDMAAKGYFSHVGPDGKEPWAWISGAGYAYRYAGENLAVRFDDSSSVVNAWMASPTHRANIVKAQYTEIGIGVAQGSYEGSPATFVVQYFGTPQEASAAALAPTQSTESKPIAATTPASAEVAGASTEEKPVVHAPSSTPPQASTPVPEAKTDAAPSSHAVSSAREDLQSYIRASDASQGATQWMLGGIAALLLIIVALAIFVHIEIQPTEILLGGAFVGAVAASLFMINASFNDMAPNGSAQSASAANAVHIERSILVGDGASTEVRF
jgi:uncharacterized protein YkwD